MNTDGHRSDAVALTVAAIASGHGAGCQPAIQPINNRRYAGSADWQSAWAQVCQWPVGSGGSSLSCPVRSVTFLIMRMFFTLAAFISSMTLAVLAQENPVGEFAGETDVGAPKLAGSA